MHFEFGQFGDCITSPADAIISLMNYIKRTISETVVDLSSQLPVEIKRTATPLVEDVRNFDRVREKGMRLGDGALVCLADQAVPLPGGVKVVPVGSI